MVDWRCGQTAVQSNGSISKESRKVVRFWFSPMAVQSNGGLILSGKITLRSNDSVVELRCGQIAVF